MSGLKLIERADLFGERTAFTGEGDPVTYYELLAMSAALAATLLAKGSSGDLREARVAFAVPPGPEYAVIQWAIWRAGGIAVPLNIGATLAEMQHVVETAGVKELIVLRETCEKVRPLCGSGEISLTVYEETDFSLKANLPEIAQNRRAMILFTSGTTNKPKGVVTTHANIVSQVETLVEYWQWQKTDVIPLFLPMHHVHGIINVMTCALYSGAAVDSYRAGFDITRILHQVGVGAYTVFMAVPTIYVKLIRALEQLDFEARAKVCAGFKAMRLMISGSAALPVKIHMEWQALTSQVLLERYGMTEIGMALSNPVDGERRPGAVGLALPGVSVQLVSEGGEVITTEDMPGEIWIKGDAVFLEYWNNEDATAGSFRDGWFMTGDMAVKEDGYYRIMGRLSIDIIKSGGYKLSALEIENTLLGHEAIKECAVIGVSDDTWGEVVACVLVLKENSSLTLDELKGWSKNEMSAYKIPRKLLILENLPRNAMGKVTKTSLKKMF